MKVTLLKVLWKVVILVVLAMYMGSFHQYPAEEVLFPRLVGYPVAALVVISLISEGVSAWRRKSPSPGRAEHTKEEPKLAGRDLLFGILLGVLYLALWLPLGFIVDTVLFLFLTPLLLKHSRRQAPLLAAIAVGMAFLFSFLFHLGSGAILPGGLLNVGWF